MRSGGPGFARTSAIAVLAALLASAVCGSAMGQSAREPILVSVDGPAVTFVGRVPWRIGDDLSWSQPDLDDATWGTMPVPSYWHSEGLDASDRVAWYRVHVRLPDGPRPDLGMTMPPASAAWEVWVNGRLAAHNGVVGGGLGRAGREAHRVVRFGDVPLRRGDNVVAIRMSSAGGLGGLLGPLRFGSVRALEKKLGRRSLLTGGLLLVFFVLTLFHLLVWGVSPADRKSLLFAGTMACVSLYALANNDHWYLVMESTEWKLRLRWAARFGIHGFGILFIAESIIAEVSRPARTLFIAAGVAAAVSLLAPFGFGRDLNGLGWLLTVVTLLYALDLAQGLPTTSPMIASGVRAGMVGSMLAMFFEVLTGIHELPGPGPFEIGTLPLAFALVGTVAIGAGLAHLRSARVVAASRDGLIVLRDGAVELSNPAMRELVGRSAVNLRDDGLGPVLTPDSRGILGEAVARLAAGVDVETPVLDLIVDGIEGPIATEVLGVSLDSERILLSFRDVTQRQELERGIARAQRLDSLGMLAGGIAHDFNNLLAGILASASDLDPDEGSEERGRRLDSIVAAARRGGGLTQRLLQFARGRAESPLGVDLERAVPDMVDMLGRTLGRNIEWNLDIEEDVPPVAVDESELEQLLVNLCVNARDAMAPSGGLIDVSVHTIAGRDGIEAVGLVVRDEGPGIPPDIVDRVFEPFVTTKGSGAGTGLGLAVVYGIVRNRGGDVLLDTTPGIGTTVTLLLPVLEEDGTDSLPEAGLRLEPEPGLRVLLVDDEPSLRKFLARALERRGHSVETLNDGQAAVEWMGRQNGTSSPVDAVVMDMMMPVVDGMEATLALRERWPGLPVVISSGYTGRDSIGPLQKTGPTLVLAKPYQVDDLLVALARVTSEAASEG